MKRLYEVALLASGMVGSVGCYPTYTVAKRGEPQTALEHLRQGSAIRGHSENADYTATSKTTDHGVVVEIHPVQCREVEVTAVEYTEVEKRRAGNVASIVLGAAAVAGGVAALAASPGASTETHENCGIFPNTSEEPCEEGNSEQDILYAGGLLSVITGSVMVGYGAMRHPPRRVVGSSVEQERVEGEVVPCTSEVEGVRVTLGQARLSPPQSTDASGRAVFTLSDGSLLGVSDPKVGILVAGELSGEVDLVPLIAAAKRRAKEAEVRAAAEDRARIERADAAAIWSGALFGDSNLGSVDLECQARGAERCFDLLDNDCDGRYDTGCGYESGVMQWTLRWDGPADLDLHVVGPDGVEVYYRYPRHPPMKLILDKDCKGIVNGQPDCPEGNIENVYIPRDEEPVPGTYRAWVEVYDLHGATELGLVSCGLAGRIGTRTWNDSFTLAPTVGARYWLAYAIGPDQDGDGVGDAQDACLGTAGRWSDLSAACGCPDQDGDGVPDSLDRCPDRTGLTQPEADQNGCPLVFGDAWVTNLGVQIQTRVEFDTGKSTLRPRSRVTLDNVARAIAALPGGVRRLAIDGHTDSRGGDAANLRLSFGRAQAVTAYLLTRGVPAGKLVARGFGETKPVSDNETVQGRQDNRRVEVWIVEPRPAAPPPWTAVAGDAQD